MSTHDVSLTVDGTAEEVTVEARRLLVHTLRDELGYTAPHVGCESGKCGACTVELDGRVVKSCCLLTVQADGGDVTTVAGLDGGDEESPAAAGPSGPERLHPVQEAFHEEHGLQCGFCTPGMVLTARELVAENPDPSREEIRRGLKGNVCRCTGYHNVVDAVEAAAARLSPLDVDGDATAASPERSGDADPEGGV